MMVMVDEKYDMLRNFASRIADEDIRLEWVEAVEAMKAAEDAGMDPAKHRDPDRVGEHFARIARNMADRLPPDLERPATTCLDDYKACLAAKRRPWMCATVLAAGLAAVLSSNG